MTTPIILHKLPAVKLSVKMGTTSIYAAIKAKTFPAPIKTGSRAVAWLESDIENWKQSRPLSTAKA